MTKFRGTARILFIAAGLLLLSMLLMIAVIPGILSETSNAYRYTAVYAILAALIIRLLIFMGYIIVIRKNKRDSKQRRPGYLVIGILLILFGLIYMDGAFAFSNNKE